MRGNKMADCLKPVDTCQVYSDSSEVPSADVGRGRGRTWSQSSEEPDRPMNVDDPLSPIFARLEQPKPEIDALIDKLVPPGIGLPSERRAAFLNVVESLEFRDHLVRAIRARLS